MVRIDAQLADICTRVIHERSLATRVDGEVSEMERLIEENSATAVEVSAATEEQTAATEQMAALNFQMTPLLSG